ncbi:hypothetical protein IT402_00590 [Candidatus Nomurabacteria bacterium]|nr:hypothetical protein [Candidatus Nomurabacteria bacterium]
MLQVIISADFDLREQKRKKEISKYKTEPIYIDDTSHSFSSLQSFLYPSLFSEESPVVHAKYLLEEFSDEITKEILTSLVSSPTIFILEERNVPVSFIKNIEKQGGTVYELKTEKKSLKKSDIFSVTGAITSPNKKDRWLAYRNALEENPAEALIGILYWKLKDIISKPGPKNSYFREVYRDLMLAHKDSWQKGFPLELAIEKTILKM